MSRFLRLTQSIHRFWRKPAVPSADILPSDNLPSYRKTGGFKPDEVTPPEIGREYHQASICLGDEFITLKTYGKALSEVPETKIVGSLTVTNNVIIKGSILTVIDVDDSTEIVLLSLALSSPLQLRYAAFLAGHAIGVAGEYGELIRNPVLPGSIIVFTKKDLQKDLRRVSKKEWGVLTSE